MGHTITLLGVPVHDVTYAETLGLIGQFVESREPHQICTVNPEFVMAAQDDAEFMAILRDADLCIPDGVGLLWAARWNKTPLRERVAGSDLVPLIAAEAASRQWRVFFLGAAAGVAERAAGELKARYPNLIVAGTWAGSPDQKDDEVAVAKIRAASPQILFVAYGAPAQDKWIVRNRVRLNVPVMMGVGGALDFITGAATRAPKWAQSLGLEWLHRLIRQPWRWRRMLALPKFAWAVMRRS
ncbi:MAG TPA: WecB/TagA/CpsF family glycosyltransferase [Anaerolineales bacterium]|nr:WecB/TagA/CpsF family glycosyltransferase [Anaerolineales bacterium]